MLESRLATKVEKALDEMRSDVAERLLLTVDEAEVEPVAEPAAAPVVKKPTNIVVTKPAPNAYRFIFPFMNKAYVVDFEPVDKSATAYNAKFYVRGFGKSDKVVSRFGINAVSTIAPLFEKIFEVMRKFLGMRKPKSVRLIPGGNLQFPTQIHTYIFEPLKSFEKTVEPNYNVIRGDAVKDGSAFILRRGGADSIKGKSWRPAPQIKKQKEVN